MFELGTIKLIISNERRNDIMKIVKSLEESSLLMNRVIETIKNEANEHKGEFVRMLLDALGSRLSGNLLMGKNTIRAGEDAIKGG